MIIYFADRNLDIQGTASTELPASIRITDDTKTEEIETGVKTFECSVLVDKATRVQMQEWCQAGNFILRSADDEDEFYQIIETNLDTSSDTFSIYAEDAGLDLLNTQVPEYTASSAHDMAWYINYYITNFAPEWEIGLDETPSSTQTLIFDSDTTLTERLLSIASAFGCEIAFSYEVEGLTITHKYIDIYEERGNQIAQNNYYINRQVQSISVKHSIAELATAYEATGDTPKGGNKPITVQGADLSSDGDTTHSPARPDDDYQIVGKQVRCISAMGRWSSRLDADGLLVKPYSYNTTSQRELFSHAVSELKKVKDGVITYDVTFYELPDVKVGDRINIVDDNDEIYVEARVLKLERSVTSDTVNAELGDYVIKSAGISERLAELAQRVRQGAIDATSITWVSSNGSVFHNQPINTVITVTVWYGSEAITSQADLEATFGQGAKVCWYVGGSKIAEGFSATISSANNTETINIKVEI